jgi:hypothetical protein
MKNFSVCVSIAFEIQCGRCLNHKANNSGKKRRRKNAVCWKINKLDISKRGQNIFHHFHKRINVGSFFSLPHLVFFLQSFRLFSFDLINFFMYIHFSSHNITPLFMQRQYFSFQFPFCLSDCWQCHFFFTIQLIMLASMFLSLICLSFALSCANCGTNEGPYEKQQSNSTQLLFSFCMNRIISTTQTSTEFFMLRWNRHHLN